MLAYTQRVGKSRMTAQLNITNLLDKDYYGSSDGDRNSIIPGEPLTFLGSVRVEF